MGVRWWIVSEREVGEVEKTGNKHEGVGSAEVDSEAVTRCTGRYRADFGVPGRPFPFPFPMTFLQSPPFRTVVTGPRLKSLCCVSFPFFLMYNYHHL